MSRRKQIETSVAESARTPASSEMCFCAPVVLGRRASATGRAKSPSSLWAARKTQPEAPDPIPASGARMSAGSLGAESLLHRMAQTASERAFHCPAEKKGVCSADEATRHQICAMVGQKHQGPRRVPTLLHGLKYPFFPRHAKAATILNFRRTECVALALDVCRRNPQPKTGASRLICPSYPLALTGRKGRPFIRRYLGTEQRWDGACSRIVRLDERLFFLTYLPAHI